MDAVPLVFCALESTYAALAIMTHHGMPKQLYKDEVRACLFPIFWCVVLRFLHHSVVDVSFCGEI